MLSAFPVFSQDESGSSEWFHIEQGDWSFYPGFRSDGTIAGLLAIADTAIVTDNNFGMIYFEYNGDDNWTSWAWKQSHPVDAVLFARERDADVFENSSPWHLDPRLEDDQYIPDTPQELINGFATGDPLGEALVSVNAPTEIVEGLATIDYPVAPILSASQFGNTITTNSADDDCLRSTVGNDEPTLEQYLKYAMYESHEWARTTGRELPPGYDSNSSIWDIGRAIVACWPCRGCTVTTTRTWTVVTSQPVIGFITWCQYDYTVTYTTTRTGLTLLCNVCVSPPPRTCTTTVVLPVLPGNWCFPATGPLFDC